MNNCSQSEIDIVNVSNVPADGDDALPDNYQSTQTDLTYPLITICNELLSKHWISDQIFQKYFEILNNKLLLNKSCLVFNPVISHAVKTLTNYEQFLHYIDLPDKDYLFIPINNSTILDKVSGSHWSVLVYDRLSNQFYYIDPIKNHNLNDTKIVMGKLADYLNIKERQLTHVLIEKQLNGYDCGVYSILIIESLLLHILSNGKPDFALLESLSFEETDLIQKQCNVAYVLNNGSNTSADTIFSLLKNSFMNCKPRDSFFSSSGNSSDQLDRLKNDLSLSLIKISDLKEQLTNDGGKIVSQINMISKLKEKCGSLQKTINTLTTQNKIIWADLNKQKKCNLSTSKSTEKANTENLTYHVSNISANKLSSNGKKNSDTCGQSWKTYWTKHNRYVAKQRFPCSMPFQAQCNL